MSQEDKNIFNVVETKEVVNTELINMDKKVEKVGESMMLEEKEDLLFKVEDDHFLISDQEKQRLRSKFFNGSEYHEKKFMFIFNDRISRLYYLNRRDTCMNWCGWITFSVMIILGLLILAAGAYSRSTFGKTEKQDETWYQTHSFSFFFSFSCCVIMGAILLYFFSCEKTTVRQEKLKKLKRKLYETGMIKEYEDEYNKMVFNKHFANLIVDPDLEYMKITESISTKINN